MRLRAGRTRHQHKRYRCGRFIGAGVHASISLIMAFLRVQPVLNVGRSALIAAALLLAPSGAAAQLRGHGGPVRALSISADGKTLLSGSFDGSAIRWSLARDTAEQVLRFHDDAVNATALFKDGRAATAGADGRIAI